MSQDMAQKIKDLRASKGLTLEQVADVVGVGKSTVRKWETGMIANMRRDKIAALANALGTTPAYLMGWKEDDEPETKKDSPDELQLTEREIRMLALFRQIPEDRQESALDVLEVFLKMRKKP